MRAVVIEEYQKPLFVRDVEPLPLGPRELRIATGASGVCRSDLSAWKGQYTALKLPLVAGHEGAGTVLEVGQEVTRAKPGDRVVVCVQGVCGDCWQCLNNRTHLCETAPGLMGVPHARYEGLEINAQSGVGTMAELITSHEASVVKLDTDLPDEQIALLGCGITTGVASALWTAEVKPGSSVAIFGCGGVGMSVLQGARIAGAAQIIAVDPFASKREAALKLGATDTVDPTAGDPVAQVKELTGGRGAEYTFEVVGRLDTIRQTFDAACRGGTVTFVGALSASLEIGLPANALHADGKRIAGSWFGSAQIRRDIPRLVALAEAGKLNLEEMVSRRIHLEDINEAFAAMEAGEVIRSVIML